MKNWESENQKLIIRKSENQKSENQKLEIRKSEIINWKGSKCRNNLAGHDHSSHRGQRWGGILIGNYKWEICSDGISFRLGGGKDI